MHHPTAHTHDAQNTEHSEVLLLELRVSIIAPFKKASVNMESRVRSTCHNGIKTTLVFQSPTFTRLWKTMSDALQVWVKCLRCFWGWCHWIKNVFEGFFFGPSRFQSYWETRGWTLSKLAGLFPSRRCTALLPPLHSTPLRHYLQCIIVRPSHSYLPAGLAVLQFCPQFQYHILFMKYSFENSLKYQIAVFPHLLFCSCCFPCWCVFFGALGFFLL